MATIQLIIIAICFIVSMFILEKAVREDKFLCKSNILKDLLVSFIISIPFVIALTSVVLGN